MQREPAVIQRRTGMGCLRGALLAVIVGLLTATPANAQLVTRVIDGDTILVEGVGRVRLIGVDTPETVDPRRPVQVFGKEASAFTTALALDRVVRLEFDVTRTDRFNRTLAYVYLPDGAFLNAEIVRQGYGHAYTSFPFRYLEDFRALEREARDAGRGLLAPTRARWRQ
jgi:micrococcal nuclease